MRDLSLYIMDIAQNSIAAGATLIRVGVEQDTAAGTALIAVTDNGRGMDSAQLNQIQSPFYTTRKTRTVGLGVPLFKMACEMTGGSFSIQSSPGEGTEVRALFHTAHIDMTPLGDLSETVLLLITCNPSLDFVYRRRRDGGAFTLDTRELRGELGGDVALNNPEVSAWIREFLADSEAALG